MEMTGWSTTVPNITLSTRMGPGCFAKRRETLNMRELCRIFSLLRA
jgi:hypothetical protein